TADTDDLGVTEIARHLDISKAVVHRILTSLRDRDLVAVDPSTRRYSLGPAVLQLADAYRSSLDIRVLGLEAMRALSEKTSETATMSVRHGDHRVYVDQVTPDREVKMSVQVGSSFPLHAGATGKAFLAWLTDAEREEYLAGSLDAVTDSTVTDPAVLTRELEAIRRQGFAVSMGERQAGAGSVAAPVLDHQGVPVVVISACGPVERFGDAVAGTAAEVVETTRRLSARLGSGS
ncbi:MAG: IclR family transcriptional regulator, partial [Actinomycetota bacterium]